MYESSQQPLSLSGGRISRLLYWMLTGALTGFGLLALLGIGMPFLLAGMVLVAGGLAWLGPRELWAALLSFGALPAALLLDSYFGTRRCPALTGAQQAGLTAPGWCGQVPQSALYLGLGFAVVALSGAVWGARWLLRERARRRA